MFYVAYVQSSHFYVKISICTEQLYSIEPGQFKNMQIITLFKFEVALTRGVQPGNLRVALTRVSTLYFIVFFFIHKLSFYKYSYPLIHLFVHSFIYSFMHELIHPYIHPYIHSQPFVNILKRPDTPKPCSRTQLSLLVSAFIRSFLHSFIHSFIHSCMS